jgi:hypothetical protein
MRIARTARVLGLGVAAALLVAGTVSTAAQGAPVVTVDNVTFAKPALTVSGVATVTQAVLAHIVDPTAAPGPAPVTPGVFQDVWLFDLAATGGSGTVRAISVLPVLVSGTWADGVWKAVVNVPSTADGTWSLTGVVRCSQDCSPGGSPEYAPAGTSTFTVTGHHQPRFSVGATPSPVPYPSLKGYVKGRVIDADTKKGMPGVTVGWGSDTNCVQFPPDGPIGFRVEKKTDANGYYSFGPVDFRGLQCAGIWGSVRHNSDGYSIFPAFRTWSVRVIPVITAKPSATSRPVGQFVAVNGTVRATVPGGIKVRVEQLYGRSVWKIVAVTTVRASGRWTSVAKPTVKGRNVFRAVTVSNPSFAPAASPSFVVTGT